MEKSVWSASFLKYWPVQVTPASAVWRMVSSWPTAQPSVGVGKTTLVSSSSVGDLVRRQLAPSSSESRMLPLLPTATMRLPARARPSSRPWVARQMAVSVSVWAALRGWADEGGEQECQQEAGTVDALG